MQKLDHVYTIFSKNFIGIGNIEIGLKLSGSVFLSPLWIGETCDISEHRQHSYSAIISISFLTPIYIKMRNKHKQTR